MTALGHGFTTADLEVSASHPELVEPIPDRYLPNARDLAEDVLAPLARWAVRQGLDLRIDSGYRPPPLNRAVGGASSSFHLTADAADVYFVDRDGELVPEAAVLAARWLYDSPSVPVGEVEVKGNALHVTNQRRGNVREFLLAGPGGVTAFDPDQPGAWVTLVAWVGAVAGVLALGEP